MAIAVAAPAFDLVDVPAAVHRTAARTVIRWLVPLQVALVGLGVVEVATSGEVLPLQLAALAVLVSTLPGTLIATDAVARYRIDGTLRRMELELQPHATGHGPAT